MSHTTNPVSARPPTLTPLLMALALALPLAGWSSAQAQSLSDRKAHVERAEGGRALATALGGDRRAAVLNRLRSRGLPDHAVQSLVETSRATTRAGRTQVTMEQQVNGLAVHGSSLRATFNGNGDLVHLIDKLAPVPTTAPRTAAIGEQRALELAMGRVHPGVGARFALKSRGARDTRFDGGSFFHQDPQVTRVLVPEADGSLSEGFLVQTWSQKSNQLDHTLVSGSGEVLSVENRTANDSYNVFTVDPATSPQTVMPGPGAGNLQSPAGWLAGTQTTFSIQGNNVSSYLDADANNRADTGGTTVTNATFATTANLTQAPTTATNKAVAVQNLFYLNNAIHDRLYRHGFNEAAGNFQTNNFGKGGVGNDPVNAEAQDGSGTNNANFATPPDGQRPRMQMYLWSGVGPTHEVAVSGGPTYAAIGATFGTQLSTAGISGTVVVGNDGVGVASDGCTALPSTVRNRIVLLDRGNCDFTVKVQNAANARAAGVIVANNTGGTAIFAMSGTANVRIPAVMISQNDGAALKLRSAPTATLRKKAVQPVQIDASLDSDVVFHEYGHGLTWRMIGSMSGPLAGALGEGASDVVAMMVNGNDVVGEYSSGSPNGIRRYRYEGYPLTYANVTGASVHNDGEIYAAAMWRLRSLWLASGRSNDSLFDHFVGGMNYTAPGPAFEDMRNGLLDDIAASGATDAAQRCALVWQAFAQFGIGDGASGVVSGSTVSIIPSTAARSDCSH